MRKAEEDVRGGESVGTAREGSAMAQIDFAWLGLTRTRSTGRTDPREKSTEKRKKEHFCLSPGSKKRERRARNRSNTAPGMPVKCDQRRSVRKSALFSVPCFLPFRGNSAQEREPWAISLLGRQGPEKEV